MREKDYSQLEAEVSEKFNAIISELSGQFKHEIANLESESGRDRICLLEEMIHNARVASDAAYLNFASNLISNIDEEELIERKKANTNRKG